MKNRQRSSDVQLFPKEIIEFSTESFTNKIGVRSQLIYVSIIVLVVVTLTSLPFIRVPVSIQSRGAIRSEQTNAIVVSPVTGEVIEILATENAEVEAGQTIVRIESPQLNLQRELIGEQLSDLEDEATDLSTLLTLDDSWATLDLSHYPFKTRLYQTEYLRDRRAMTDLQDQARFDKEHFDVNRTLFEKDYISRVEFMGIKHEYQRAVNRLALFTEDKTKLWQAALRRTQQRIDELSTDLLEVENEQQRFRITAPVSGVVQQVEKLKGGSYVATGQTVAVVSPSGNLIAEIYVATRDIGLIDRDTPVSLQIDAFNHLEWGQLTGTIDAISKDVYLLNGIPMFRILCNLDRHSLFLSNGAEGRLKKGMAFTARFEVANRTVFQLLRDQIDDWFSPYKADDSGKKPKPRARI